MSEVKRCCTVTDCSLPSLAREMCNKHWKRWRKYGNAESIVVAPKKTLAEVANRSQRHYVNHASRYAAYGVEYRKLNAYRRSAQFKVAYAIKTGSIVRPEVCSKCLRSCKPQAHHDDYSKPLDVHWLCVSCHRKEHGGIPCRK